MSIVVEHFSSVELTARRADILARLGGDEDRVRELAADYLLNAEDSALFDELENIDYLLGN